MPAPAFAQPLFANLPAVRQHPFVSYRERFRQLPQELEVYQLFKSAFLCLPHAMMYVKVS